MNPITYEVVDTVNVEELIAFYKRQGHDTTESPEKLERMIENTFCFVIARQSDRVVGIARGVTDGVRGWLTECKLDPACQGPAAITRVDGRIEHDEQGIARQMAQRVIQALCELGVDRIDVFAYGTEEDFCEELGFRRSGGVVAMTLRTDESRKSSIRVPLEVGAETARS